LIFTSCAVAEVVVTTMAAAAASISTRGSLRSGH
jgi:hypothetical protein